MSLLVWFVFDSFYKQMKTSKLGMWQELQTKTQQEGKCNFTWLPLLSEFRCESNIPSSVHLVNINEFHQLTRIRCEELYRGEEIPICSLWLADWDVGVWSSCTYVHPIITANSLRSETFASAIILRSTGTSDVANASTTSISNSIGYKHYFFLG